MSIFGNWFGGDKKPEGGEYLRTEQSFSGKEHAEVDPAIEINALREEIARLETIGDASSNEQAEFLRGKIDNILSSAGKEMMQ